MASASAMPGWRLLDIPSNCRLAGGPGTHHASQPGTDSLSGGLNLSESRTGALSSWCVIRRSVRELVAPLDRMTEEVAADDPRIRRTSPPRLTKQALHHAVRGASLCDLEPTVLE